MAVNWKDEGRKVSIEEAKELVKVNPNIEVNWRPESELPESEQYALIAGE